MCKCQRGESSILLEKCSSGGMQCCRVQRGGQTTATHATALSSPASLPLFAAASQEWLAIGNGLRDLGEVLPLDAQDWFAVRYLLQGCALSAVRLTV